MANSEPFRTYASYLQDTFGAKTYKVVVSSQLTCPTRDGTLAKRGCAFCDVRGSSSFHGKKGRGTGVLEQLESRIDPIRKRFGAQKILAYFQSYTNTYSDTSKLRALYEDALSHPEVSGLCIGTRPDCLGDEVLELLEEVASRKYLSLELGVQSFENATLEWLTRGHDGQCSIDALARLRERAPHVHTCAHLMFGSPTDAPDMPERAAELLNASGVRGVKLHQVMVLEHTELAERYRAAPWPMITLEEYGSLVARFLEKLDPSIYIERLYATATHPEECLGPDWSRERWRPHNELRRMLSTTAALG